MFTSFNFIYGRLREVPFPFLRLSEVPSMIQIKTKVGKNILVRPHEVKGI